MWFNNLLVYEYELDDKIDLNEALATETLKPCPPHARSIYGWLPPFEEDMLHEVAGAALLCFAKEERILPRAVIEKVLKDRIFSLENEQGRKVGRTEKSQIAEDVEFELLPKSFCIQKRMYAVLDKKSKRLYINTSSATQAGQLTALLRKSVPSLELTAIFPSENLAVRFAEWISKPETLPKAFQLAPDCLLFSLDDDKKRFSCKGYESPADEIIPLLTQGLVVAEISLHWNERIQFTLTRDLIFKRLKSLDYLVDELSEIGDLEEEALQRDAEITLLSGELRGMIDALLKDLDQNLNQNQSQDQNQQSKGNNKGKTATEDNAEVSKALEVTE